MPTKDGKLTEEELEKAYQELQIMVQTMQDIYFKNLIFFEDNNKKLYKLIQKEAKQIEKNKEKEKYAVELNKIGALDIINREDDSYLYKKDPFKIGDKIAKKLDGKSVAFKNIGLGTHVSTFVKTKKPKKILICEKDIQLFRCSMYVTDYEELSSLTKIKFNIASKCTDEDYKEVYKLKL